MTDSVIRVPNLPLGKLVDESFNATDDELTFRHTLITCLQKNFGNEGVVIPTQDSANIAIIEANQNENLQYTCQAGTFIYDSDTDTVKVSILVAGVPVFKTVTVT